MKRFLVPADARSWIDALAGSDFPIQNLPFGRAMVDGEMRHVTRVGDHVVDLTTLGYDVDLATITPEDLCAVRSDVFHRLRDDATPAHDAVIPADRAQMVIPIRPKAFVDFYSGIHHASNVGRMFRPDQPPLLPNYRHLPVGYNGRASTVVVAGVEITRPCGQTKAPDAELPSFGPTKALDFELELGFYTGRSNVMGRPIRADEVESYMLGLVIVNDWSARDVQTWEYQPLGPFLAKSFATSISPWVVTFDALEPFRRPGMEQDPEVLPHLRFPNAAHYDIQLEVTLQSERMTHPQVISRSNAMYLYWSFVQQLLHQASNGTLIEAGDLYGSGTISAPEESGFGSMLELTWRGAKPITLHETGEERKFLADGDTLSIRAFCDDGVRRIGFGEVSGKVRPACP